MTDPEVSVSSQTEQLTDLTQSSDKKLSLKAKVAAAFKQAKAAIQKPSTPKIPTYTEVHAKWDAEAKAKLEVEAQAAKPPAKATIEELWYSADPQVSDLALEATLAFDKYDFETYIKIKKQLEAQGHLKSAFEPVQKAHSESFTEKPEEVKGSSNESLQPEERVKLSVVEQTPKVKIATAYRNPAEEVEFPNYYEMEGKDPFVEIEDLYERNIPVEQLIEIMERKLGIETDTQRVLEASLLVDKKFMATAIIAGYKKPERLFGDEAYADWLSARYATQQYGDKPLTVEFVQKLHTHLTRRLNPKISGQVRDTGLIGGDYKKLGKPVTYTQEQADALRNNPAIGFEQVGEDPNTGLIVYPAARKKEIVDRLSDEGKKVYYKHPSNKALVEAMLLDLSTWYNGEKAKPDHDSYLLAAELQQRAVSIHPFRDVNGRTSKALMNWSLESEGIVPSILAEPSDDLLSSPKRWVDEVYRGCRLYRDSEVRREQLEQIGYEDLAEVTGLTDEKTFYDYIYRQIKTAPPPPQNGEVMTHQPYEDFIKDFNERFAEFKQQFEVVKNYSVPETKEGETYSYGNHEVNVKQGGLIPESYINLVNFRPKDAAAYQNYMRSHFYSSTEVYRGGITPEQITEDKLVKMFEQYTGLGSGYKAGSEARVSPLSTQNVSARNIVVALKNCNNLMAQAYLYADSFDEITIPGEEYPIQKKDVWPSIVQGHLLANDLIRQSPYASTSFNLGTSAGWADPRSTLVTPDAKFGVLFSALTPGDGAILGFGQRPGWTEEATSKSDLPALSGTRLTMAGEWEFMMPGGINPATINKVKVYGKRQPEYGWEETYTAFEAKRVEELDGIYLSVDSPEKNLSSGNMITKTSTYKLNPATGKYELQPVKEAPLQSASS